MIKWEKPMLISLTDAAEGEDYCEPGSNASGDCYKGTAAGVKCEANGASAVGECREFGSSFSI